jgi:uncharacterized protein
MNFQLFLSNLTNPTLLFFVLGILAVRFKSDLAIPKNSAKFISLYLLFAIGFKGGQELAHSTFSIEIVLSLIFGLLVSIVIPFYTFFILKRKFSIYDASAVAAAYGSVSAVTFVAASSFLEFQKMEFGGHMVAVMALMEAPAIIIGVYLLNRYAQQDDKKIKIKETIIHAFTNGSVFLIIGSLIIGFISDSKQAEGIKPFTTDIFKGFLAIFLLDMGISCGRKLTSFFKYGWFSIAFAIIIPLFNGIIVAFLSGFFIADIGNRFMFSILAASASYIAVPAAMKLANPKADAGLFIPMALGVTFPINITLGMPLYELIIKLS